MSEAQRICYRCLLEEVSGEAELKQLIAERVAALPDELRADQTEYTSRLQCCKACDALRSGMCSLCGCYVELRAAKRKMHCPALPAKW